MIFTRMFKSGNLWAAAKRGDVETIKRLVEEGHDLNAKRRSLNMEGDTPLHVATQAGQREAIRVLVELGAKINARNDLGATPLAYAVAERRRPDVVALLLDLGSDVNAKEKCGDTVLDSAAFYGNEAAVKLLLERGAQLNPQANSGGPSPLARCIESGNLQLLKFLIAAGADVNAPDGTGSPLSNAAVDGRLDLVKILLEAGADPSRQNESGHTPLMSAVASGKLQIVTLLVQFGADLNAVKWSLNETALDFAERLKKAEIVEFLKSAGAKHASELPFRNAKPEEEEREANWQLGGDSFLIARIEPWPPKSGPGQLKVSVTEDDYHRAFKGTLEFRLGGKEQNDELWRVMPETGRDEDGDVYFEVPITLKNGTVYIQFRIDDERGKEITELTDWKLEVQ